MSAMELSRRKFFGLLGGVVAATVAAPIFVVPPPKGWRASKGLILLNAAAFQDGGSVEFFSKDCRKQEYAQISYVDVAGHTVWFKNPLPEMVTPGAFILRSAGFAKDALDWHLGDGNGLLATVGKMV